MNVNGLTRRELVDLLEIVDAATKITTEQQMLGVLKRVGKLIPINRSLIGLGQLCGDRQVSGLIAVVQHGYPDDWIGDYVHKAMFQQDPFIYHHLSFPEARIWRFPHRSKNNVVGHINALKSESCVIMGMPDRHESPAGYFCFTCEEAHRTSRHVQLLEFLKPHLYQGAVRGLGAQRRRAPVLTPREKEVLNWLLAGKTNWEISAVLQISERTVKFHVGNILEKLDAMSRAHAVAKALQYGIVELA